MPQLIVTRPAAEALQRCITFLAERDHNAAARASAAIASKLRLFMTSPAIGRPFDAGLQFRELVIPFGVTGLVALCKFDHETDTIYLLAFRHQREAGY